MFPQELWQPPGWAPQVLASPPGLGPRPGCSSLSRGVYAGPGTLAAPPDSAIHPEAVLGPPCPSPEVSPSAAPSQRSWLMSLGAARSPGAAGPPRVSWEEGALRGPEGPSSGRALRASQGVRLPEGEVRGR